MFKIRELLAILKVVLPLPDFKDAAAVEAWLNGLSPTLAKLISQIASQFNQTGSVELELDGGQVVSLYEEGGLLRMSDDHQAQLCLAIPEANGKWLEIIQMLLPILLKILPLFLQVEPTPTPPPTPAPGPETV